jgi:hypothetical protein
LGGWGGGGVVMNKKNNRKLQKKMKLITNVGRPTSCIELFKILNTPNAKCRLVKTRTSILYTLKIFYQDFRGLII